MRDAAIRPGLRSETVTRRSRQALATHTRSSRSSRMPTVLTTWCAPLALEPVAGLTAYPPASSHRAGRPANSHSSSSGARSLRSASSWRGSRFGCRAATRPKSRRAASTTRASARPWISGSPPSCSSPRRLRRGRRYFAAGYPPEVERRDELLGSLPIFIRDESSFQQLAGACAGPTRAMPWATRFAAVEWWWPLEGSRPRPGAYASVAAPLAPTGAGLAASRAAWPAPRSRPKHGCGHDRRSRRLRGGSGGFPA